ncbi:hypothetical protein O7632_05360 [Solwaraspora sp. WMMD406]|uniref:hypothetical protein n=1 Tax=Solwaraspora sp. WMMD406 TaxID=3016095 RepID=UPI0024167646|nr:hypothetical protein [Solwaraspora sp. WMMD406]MDG4763539.1 hypothetical protein [Solwaraspora sp. WMMD406]
MSTPGAVSSAAPPHNDWSGLEPPDLGGWTPTATVSVVLVGNGDPTDTARTRAALRQQRYPDGLVEVVSCAGDHTFPDEVAEATGEIVLRIPAGAIPAPGFVAALTRWQQASPDAVSFAVPMVWSGTPADPDVIAAHAAADTLGQIFPGAVARPGLVERLAATHQLRTVDHLGFLVTADTGYAFRRDRYQAGADPCQGADVEVAYRLAQAGALFVPESAAVLWMPADTGPAATRRRAAAELTDLVPYPRERRHRPGRIWQVPLVTAIVAVDQPYEVVRTCVDHLLASDERDLHVALVGDWDASGWGRADGGTDLRLLATEYRFEPRVRMVSAAPASAYPAPYLLRVPARLRVGAGTVGAMIAAAERWRCGLLRVLPAGAGSAAHAVELWSTAARSRAQRAGVPDGALADAVAASHGQRWETGSEFDVADVVAAGAATGVGAGAAGLVGGAAAPGIPGQGGRQVRQTVAVGGARSLGRATVFVARRYARDVRRRLVPR